MAIVHRESRSRIGIIWFDDETEAERYAARQAAEEDTSDADIGTVQCGRDRGFDRPGMYAVVTP